MTECLMLLAEDLMIVSSRLTVKQDLSNFFSSERSTSPRSKPIAQGYYAIIAIALGLIV